MHQSNSWVVQTADGKRSVEFAAFQQLCGTSPWAHCLCIPLGWITPLGTRIYRLVSHHRRRAWQVLDALRSYLGAVVLVTHDPGAAEALEPQRVVLLPDGTEDHWSEDYAGLIELA